MTSPSRFAAIAASALVAAAVGPARAFAGTLTVMLERVACPDAEWIAQTVEREASGFLVAATPDLVLVVRPADANALTLRLVGLGKARVRTIPFHSRDCAALPGALSVVLNSWLSHRLVDAYLVGVDVEDARATDLRLAAGHPESERRAEAPPLVPERSRRRFVLAAMGGGYFPGGQPGAWPQATAMGTVGLSSTGWGAGVMGSYRAAPAVRESWGTLRADSGLVAALGTLRLRLSDVLELDLLGGPALEVLHARAGGFAKPRSATGTTFAGFGSVQLRGVLTGRLGWIAAVDAMARLQSLEFTVDGSAVGRIGPVGAGAQLGLWWDAS